MRPEYKSRLRHKKDELVRSDVFVHLEPYALEMIRRDVEEGLSPKKPKALIAEDEPSMRRHVQMIMSRWDCELAIESTAEGAIQRAATFQPDVALLGFVTPGMDGAKAGIELLRVSPGTQIVLFNESVPADIVSELKARGYNFRTLAAPFGEKELRDCCFQQVRLSAHFEGYRVK